MDDVRKQMAIALRESPAAWPKQCAWRVQIGVPILGPISSLAVPRIRRQFCANIGAALFGEMPCKTHGPSYELRPLTCLCFWHNADEGKWVRVVAGGRLAITWSSTNRWLGGGGGNGGLVRAWSIEDASVNRHPSSISER